MPSSTDRIRQVAGWLVTRGIGPDDVVAVLMKNIAAFLELVFAASHIGAVFLPINYRLSADEVGYIVGNSGARLLIADEELAAIAAGDAPVVLLDEAAQARRHAACSRCRARADASAASARPDAADVHLGHHRSPQGRDAHLREHVLEVGGPDLVLGLNADTRLLVVGPLYHVGALDLPGIAVLVARRPAVHSSQFRAGAALAAIETRKAQCRVVRAGHDHGPPRLPRPRPLRRLQPEMGRSAAARRRRRRAFAPSRVCSGGRATSTPMV